MFRPLSQTKFINDANLVSYYKLEDTSDSKGANTLTNNGTTTFSSAKFDNGADFGSANTNKSLSVASNLGIAGNGNITMSCWVKIRTEPTSNQSMVLIQHSSTLTQARYFQLRYHNVAGTKKIWLDASNSPNSGVAVTLGTTDFYHFVATRDVAGNSVKLYMNGVLIDTTTLGTYATSLTDTFYLATNGSGDFASIYSDDTAIFSRALSAGEVAELYQSMTLGEYIPNSNTKLLLHLNGSSADSSGNNNNGTDTSITYSQANGKFGQGAGFNATTDKILIANESQFDFERTTAFTISCWVKLNTSGVTRFIVAKQVASGNFNGFGLWVNSVNGMTFSLVNTPSNLIDVYSPFTTTGEWVNITVTYSGNSDVSGLKIYKNASIMPLTVTKNTLTSSILNDVQLEIGNRNGTFNFDGAMDEVIVELGAWSSEKVKKYVAFTKGRFGII